MDILLSLLSRFSFQAWAVVGLATFALLSLSKAFSKGHFGKLPPGPRGWPIIGNVFDIPDEYPWKVYRRWGQEFGRFIISTGYRQSDK